MSVQNFIRSGIFLLSFQILCATSENPFERIVQAEEKTNPSKPVFNNNAHNKITSKSTPIPSKKIFSSPHASTAQHIPAGYEQMIFVPTIPATSSFTSILESMYQGTDLSETILEELEQVYFVLEYFAKVEQIQHNKKYASLQKKYASLLAPADKDIPFISQGMDLVNDPDWQKINITQQDVINSDMWQYFLKATIADIFVHNGNFLQVIHEVETQIFNYIPSMETSYYNSDFLSLRNLAEGTRLKLLLNDIIGKKHQAQCVDWVKLSAKQLQSASSSFQSTNFYTYTHTISSWMQQDAQGKPVTPKNVSLQSPTKEQVFCYAMIKTAQNNLYAALAESHNLEHFIAQASSSSLLPNIFEYTLNEYVYLDDFFMIQANLATQVAENNQPALASKKSTTVSVQSLDTHTKKHKKRYKTEDLVQVQDARLINPSNAANPRILELEYVAPPPPPESDYQYHVSSASDFFNELGNEISNSATDFANNAKKTFVALRGQLESDFIYSGYAIEHGIIQEGYAIRDGLLATAEAVGGIGATIIGDLANDPNLQKIGHNLTQEAIANIKQASQETCTAIDDFANASKDGIIAPMADIDGAIASVLTQDQSMGLDITTMINQVEDSLVDIATTYKKCVVNFYGDLAVDAVTITEDLADVIVKSLQVINNPGAAGGAWVQLGNDMGVAILGAFNGLVDATKEMFGAIMQTLTYITSAITTLIIDVSKESTFIFELLATGDAQAAKTAEASVGTYLDNHRQTIDMVSGIVLAVAIDVAVTVATGGTGTAEAVILTEGLMTGAEAGAETGAEVALETAAETTAETATETAGETTTETAGETTSQTASQSTGNITRTTTSEAPKPPTSRPTPEPEPAPSQPTPPSAKPTTTEPTPEPEPTPSESSPSSAKPSGNPSSAAGKSAAKTLAKNREALDALKTASANTRTAANEAKTAATAARQTATTARSTASAARTAANEADQAATQAEFEAEQAGTQAAKSAATAARNAANKADQAATEAENTADQAETAATQAEQKANQLDQTATKAENATKNAEEATTKAEKAAAKGPARGMNHVLMSEGMNAVFNILGAIGASYQDELSAVKEISQEEGVKNIVSYGMDTALNSYLQQNAMLQETEKKFNANLATQQIQLAILQDFATNTAVNAAYQSEAVGLGQEYESLLTPQPYDSTNPKSPTYYPSDIGSTWGLVTAINCLYPQLGLYTTTAGRPKFPYAQEIAQAPLVIDSQAGDNAPKGLNVSQSINQLWFNQRVMIPLSSQKATDALQAEVQFRILYSLNTTTYTGLYLGGIFEDYRSKDYLAHLENTGMANLNVAHLAKMFVIIHLPDGTCNIGLHEKDGVGSIKDPQGASWIVYEPLDKAFTSGWPIYDMKATLQGNQLTLSLSREDNPQLAPWKKTVTVSPTDQRMLGIITSGTAIEWNVLSPKLPIKQLPSIRTDQSSPSYTQTIPEKEREIQSLQSWAQLLKPQFGACILNAVSKFLCMNGNYVYTTTNTGMKDSNDKPIIDYVVFANNDKAGVKNVGLNPCASTTDTSNLVIISLGSGNVYDQTGSMIGNQKNVWETYSKAHRPFSKSIIDAITTMQTAYIAALMKPKVGVFSLEAADNTMLSNGIYIYTTTQTLTIKGQKNPIIDYLVSSTISTTDGQKYPDIVGAAPSSTTQGLLSLVTGNLYSAQSLTPVNTGLEGLQIYESNYKKLPADISKKINDSLHAYTLATTKPAQPTAPAKKKTTPKPPKAIIGGSILAENVIPAGSGGISIPSDLLSSPQAQTQISAPPSGASITLQQNVASGGISFNFDMMAGPGAEDDYTSNASTNTTQDPTPIAEAAQNSNTTPAKTDSVTKNITESSKKPTNTQPASKTSSSSVKTTAPAATNVQTGAVKTTNQKSAKSTQKA